MCDGEPIIQFQQGAQNQSTTTIMPQPPVVVLQPNCISVVHPVLSAVPSMTTPVTRIMQNGELHCVVVVCCCVVRVLSGCYCGTTARKGSVAAAVSLTLNNAKLCVV